VKAAEPAILCRILGHDWDILAFGGPGGLFECMRCDEQYGVPTPPDWKELRDELRRQRP